MIARKELRRQIFHLVSGVVMALLVYAGILNKISMGVLVLAAAIISFVSRRVKIPGIYWFLSRFDRDPDLVKFPGKGALFYVVGAYIAVLIFASDIAAASIVILALGDSVSHIIGRFGSIKHPFSDLKYFEGSIAGVIAAFIGSFIILQSAIQAGLASMIAMLTEGFNLELGGKKIDDNLLLPVVAGTVIWLVRIFI